MVEDDIIVRIYGDKDYNDIIQAGYPFDPYLKRNFYNASKNLIKRSGIEKIVLRNLLLNREEIVLVAYSKKSRKAVGVITLRKITDSLWGIWHTFVSPFRRGKRIASLLYQESFKYLKKRNVKKAVTIVFVDNIASTRSIKRSWQGFLFTGIFECKKRNKMIEDKLSNKLKMRKPRNERGDLFEVFKNCVGEQYCKLLEINKTNFLDRIFGPAYFEPISKNFLTRFIMKKNVVIAEYQGKIEGYAISRVRRFFPAYPTIHLFVSISDNFEDICKGLIMALKSSMNNRKDKFKFIYTGKAEVINHLINLGFEVRQGLVIYKYL